MPLSSSDAPGNQPAPVEDAPVAEREEKTCGYCGLIYQQNTEGSENETFRSVCPRCMNIATT